MDIVIDTNIFISALIKDGTVRKILKEIKANFLFPEYEFKELNEHRPEIIEKSGLAEKEFNILFLRLLKYVKIVPEYLTKSYLDQACNVMSKIDYDDIPFVATALTLDCPIWSDDKHFKKQDKVRILTTKDMVNMAK